MQHLVIGLGEVGKAVKAVFNAVGHDYLREPLGLEPDFLHICFPYSDGFEDEVTRYVHGYKPRFTVVHSTVPVGTCYRLKVVSSPVRGIHPNLEQGVRTFQKFVGGVDVGAGEVASEFRRHNLRVLLVEKSRSAELSKLLDTEYYRACIEFTQRANRLADHYGVPFHEAYTLMNLTYNEGYQALGHPEYARPTLQAIPGPIGGHCVTPNAKLLPDDKFL